jgi:hypothetical protein
LRIESEVTKMSEPGAPAIVPDYLQRRTTRVRVFTVWGVVEGEYAHAPGVLLSNALRNAGAAERYLILTAATFRTFDGAEIDPDADSAPFVLVNPALASAIVPLNAETEVSL